MDYMIAIYGVIAVFIAWVWIDYYRLINVYGKGKLAYILITFILGACSVLIVLAVRIYVLKGVFLEDNSNPVLSLFYYIFNVGLVEEFAKAIPFLIVLFLFKNQFKEPIDYLAFMSASALGFAAAENTTYFYTYPTTIDSRAILATVSHMLDASLLAYGFILTRFKNKRFQPHIILGFFFLAVLAHGLYDFIASTKEGFGTWILLVIYFFYTISIFATILNNAMNNSSEFTYRKVINSDKVATRIITYYGIIFLLQFLVLGISPMWKNFDGYLHYPSGSHRWAKAANNFEAPFYALIFVIFHSGFIMLITALRLSRFKLIKGRWQPIKLEIPFTVGNSINTIGVGPTGGVRLKIKGESFAENFLGTYFEEYFSLYPLSKNKFLGRDRLCYIEKKLFLKYDETFYLAKIFLDDTKEKFSYILLKPKIKGKILEFDKYSIVGLLRINDITEIEDTTKSSADFSFVEWAYVKPLKPTN